MTLDTTLIIIGVGCIIAAIIGGGVKLAQVELGEVKSLWRQTLLGVFGVILVVSGLIAGGHIALPDLQGDKTPASTESPGNVASTDSGAGAGQALAGATSPPPQQPSLPGKVDIFWCVADSGITNEAIAQKIEPALRATGRIGQIRVRPLPQATNAQPDYRISRNIVRFDPGEQPAAETIAQVAGTASGVTFEATPALPGSPSINYISVFVCARN